MSYSIDARPTLELFFTTDEGQTFCVDMDGEIVPAPNEQLDLLRCTPLGHPTKREETRQAIDSAQVYARDGGWTLGDYVFFN